MKITTKFLVALGLLAAMPAMANAKGLSPGEYTLSGIQQICIQPQTSPGKGPWYSTTFPSWAGHYQIITVGTVRTTYIFGNYAGGDGNDSFVVLGAANSKWTEWRDDLSFENVIVNLAVSKVSNFCNPPAAASAKAASGNPARK